MILKLEDQVCSLESAKKLKELGVSQESLFYWRKYQNWLVDLGTNCPGDHEWTDEEVDETSAYTTAELMKLLPEMIMQDGNKTILVMGKVNGEYVIGYRPFSRIIVEFRDIYFPKAMAKMLIYLIENKLIGVPR